MRRRGRRIVTRTGVACVLAAACLTWSGLVASAPALASCSASHDNIEAWDLAFYGAYGNRGSIYVNTDATLDNLNGIIARTFSVVSSNGMNDVEFGWADDIEGYNVPTVASDSEIGGNTATATMYPSYGLSYDTDYRFRIENLGDHDIFRYVVDGQSSPIGYSPTMNFNVGFVLTNSEHYNTCDSLWTHQYGLNEQVTSGSSPVWQSYTTLACFVNDSVPAWYLHVNSETDLQVTQTASGGIGPGSSQCYVH